MNRTIHSFTAVSLTCAAFVTSAQAGGTLQTRYRAIPLGALPGGQTLGRSLNDKGHTTGESGSNAINPGTHAFLGDADGQIVSIETIDGFDISSGAVINNQGQIAGDLTVFPGQAGVSTIFRYTPGVGMVELGTIGGTSGWIVDMNEQGDIIGEWADANGVWRGFLYTDAGGMQNLDQLCGVATRPEDINDHGHVVGYYFSGAQYRGFLWDGAFHDLGTLGGDYTQAFCINNAGVIAGSSRTPDGTERAFRYTTATGMQALPLVQAGARECAVEVINENGVMAGSYRAGQQKRGFFYSDLCGMVDIGTGLGNVGWTGAIAANELGQVVFMQMDDQTYEVSGLVFTLNSGLENLNDLVVGAGVPWHISTVAGINESGQILAGTWNAAALLVPVTPGDLDGDGDVDQADLGALLANYGTPAGASYEQGDVNGDGAVNQSDLGLLLSAYGN